MSESPVIVALDFPAPEPALAFVNRLQPGSCRVKIGKELFTVAGPDLVRKIVDRGFDVFLDLKYHDIPNTVAAACRAASELGVWMLNVHALGGRRMMEAAREAVEGAAHRPRLIAVTILTSMGPDDLHEIGLAGEPAEHVARLAALAESAGLDGVVCSPREVTLLHQARGEGFLLVTPGIRPAGSETGDQKRIMTPADALRAGSTHLVIGRPITQAPDPVDALADIHEQIRNLTPALSPKGGRA